MPCFLPIARSISSSPLSLVVRSKQTRHIDQGYTPFSPTLCCAVLSTPDEENIHVEIVCINNRIKYHYLPTDLLFASMEKQAMCSWYIKQLHILHNTHPIPCSCQQNQQIIHLACHCKTAGLQVKKKQPK